MRGCRLSVRMLVALVAVLVVARPAWSEDWPCWRGPRGDGTSLELDVPVAWDGATGQNVAWKARLPGVGHASPIVWQDRIFTVTCLQQSQQRLLVCLDRRTGRQLWRQVVLETPLEGKHVLNSFASSTPATDGRNVYVSFLDRQDMVVAAYDLDGRRQWLVRPGVFSSKHGYCSSPVVFEDKVIINGDHDGEAYLVALDKATGKTVWKVDRENKTRSYCTPIIRHFDAVPHLILSGSLSVCSYDPRDGSRHWIIDGPTEQFVASMVDNGKYLFLTAGFPDRHILAIRPDGHGNITDTHVVWRTTENAAYVPSPIVVGDYFLVVSDQGIASCFVADTGQRMWKERIGPRFSASLVSAGGLAYFTSDRGVTTVVRPGSSFEVVAENDLGEDVYASAAISRGQIFLRGVEHLYCIGPDQ